MSKLVRDKIPDIIRKAGDSCSITKEEDPKQYQLALLDKLEEESLEFEEDRSIEELADILEVIYALSYTIGHTPAELETVRGAKFIQRGGFFEGYVLHDS